MSTPTSGQIKFSDINTEMGFSDPNTSLRTRCASAGLTTPDQISEFYGYSNIELSLGAITYIANNSSQINAYRTINHTNQTTLQTLSINLNYSGYAGFLSTIDWYWSLNSTSSWTPIDMISSTSSTTSSIIIPNVASTSTIRIRMHLLQSSFAYSDFTLTGGTLTGGVGTVQTTGTVYWLESI